MNKRKFTSKSSLNLNCQRFDPGDLDAKKRIKYDPMVTSTTTAKEASISPSNLMKASTFVVWTCQIFML